MPQAGLATSQKLVTELKVSGHLMTLDRGLFCVFHAQGSVVADPQTGLPGVRITQPPMQDRSRVSISSFNEDGWIGAEGSAALVRINEGPSQLLVTIYQNGSGQHEAPRLQVMRLGDVPAAAGHAPAGPEPVAAPAQVSAALPAAGPTGAEALPAPIAGAPAGGAPAAEAPAEGAEVAAHVQRRGDKLGRLGDWMGEPGSQSWIEGFAIAPNKHVGPEDIEYQAVLGKGWLSPWSEGGQYCGSRGMALPILGLRVRLKGRAVQSHMLRVSATFTDGSRVGPLSDTETAEAESLAPLEAFRIEILPYDAAAALDEDADEAGDDAAPEVPAAQGDAPVTPQPQVPAAKAAPAKAGPAKSTLAKISATLTPKPVARIPAKPAPRKPAGPPRR